MSEMFNYINGHADMVREQRDRELAALNAKRRNAHRKKATRAFLIRAILAWALVLSLWFAVGFDLVALGLAWPLQFAAMLYFMGWLGAWLQFMFCKRGLLR